MNFDRVCEYLKRELKKEKTYGMSCRVMQGYETVYNKSFGFADKENGKKMQGSELYNLYSMTKPLTCTAALQLFEKGYFLLNDLLYEYIPEFRDMTFKDVDGVIKKCSRDILIRDLFTMTAGFDYNLEGEFVKSARENGKTDTLSVIKELSKYPLSFEPGKRWQYSLCHDVLAALVETVSGEKFSEYVKKNIFTPLGMTRSGFNPKDFDEGDFAVQYKFNEKTQKTERTNLQNMFRLSNEYESGGAGLISCIDDYSKFAMALANGGIGESGARILGRRTIELMKRNHLTPEQLPALDWQELTGFGYGLGVRTLINPEIAETNAPVGEFGWNGAAGSYLLVDTENKISIVYTQHLLNGYGSGIHLPLTNIIYACFD